MMEKRQIPFGKPFTDSRELDAIQGVMKTGMLTHGPEAQKFEEEFSFFVGGGASAITLSSCMAALHLTYYNLGFKDGDEIIIPAQTHVATAHAAELMGCKPVFVDSDFKSGNINPDLIENKISKRTKAIGLVHFLGIPCNMEKIMTIAEKYHLKVIEDCALALGSKYNGKHVGTIGDAGCFSFYPAKHITTGDGGMLITRHPTFAKAVRLTRAFGVDRDFSNRTVPGIYDVIVAGYNYRLSDINSAIGRVQLKKLSEIIEIRNKNFDMLKDIISDWSDVMLLQTECPLSHTSHYAASLILEALDRERRNKLLVMLKELGIGSSVHYPHPVPRLGYYKSKYGYREDQFPNAVRISDQSINLPIGPHVKFEDIEYVAENLKKCLGVIT